MRGSIVFFIFFLVGSGLNLYGLSDNMQFRHFTINEGLPYSHVTVIKQDKKGYIWIGTRKGLYKYDGYNINALRTDTTSIYGINSYGTREICATKAGDMWVIMNDMLFRYAPERDMLEHVYIDDNLVWRFGESTDGRFFCLTEGNIFVLDSQRDKFIKFTAGKPASDTSRIYEIATDNNNRLWTIGDEGLSRIDLNNNNVVQYDVKQYFSKGRVIRVREMLVDSQNNLWIGTFGDGVIFLNTKTGEFKQMNEQTGYDITIIRAMEEDDNHHLWIGGENGLRVIDIRTQEIVRSFRQDYYNPLGINDDAVYSIFKDQDRNLWFGTFFGGINILYNDHQQVNYYAPGNFPQNVSGKAVRQMIEDGNYLWVATEDGGLNKFNKQTEKFSHIKHVRGSREGLSNNNVHALMKDRENNLWIGSFEGGINVMNMSTNNITRINTENTPALKSNMVFCFVQDEKGIIYIGTTAGLNLYDPRRKEFYVVDHPILSRKFIYNLMIDSEGNIWVSSRTDGLFCFDKQTKTIKHYSAGSHENALHDNTIMITYEDSFNNIWVGTNIGGLYLFNKETEEFKQFDVPGMCVSAIIEDNNKMLWISTEKGLVRMNLLDFKMDHFTKEDGLRTDQFNYNSALKTAEGLLFFGTINGLISFNPELMGQKRIKPKVVLSKLFILGEEVVAGTQNSPLKTNLEETEKIQLDYRQANAFAIEYAAISYGHSKSIRYAVKMDGVDKDWNVLGDQRRVNYSKLPPGSYTFSVRAILNNNNWDEADVRSLLIIIKPPFYRSGWAYLIYIITLLAIAGLILRLLSIRQQEKNQIQLERMERNKIEEINKTKMDFFTNISHELKTPLTLILTPLQRIIERKTDAGVTKETMDVILRNAQRMTRIVDELMAFSKIEIGKEKLLLQKGNVLDFIRNISNMFTLLANEKEIEYKIMIEDNGEDVWFSIPNVEKIVYNLLSNSFKFTPAKGKISIQASLIDSEDDKLLLLIEVTDNGIGISKENLDRIFENYFQADPHSNVRGSGIGLSLTKRLVNLHKGNIEVQSSLENGSIFKVMIDVSEKSYSNDEKSQEIVDKEYLKNYNFITIENDVVEKVNTLMKNFNESVKTLLLVDDNEEMLKFMSDIFKPQYRILTAENGKVALDIARREYPDLVVSDVMMPVMNGFELCKKLKESFSTCHIPVILLTAKTGADDKLEGYEMGADYYIEKPFNAQILEKQVENIINTRDNNIQIFKDNPQNDISEIFSNERDSTFVKRLNKLIEENMNNPFFSVSEITKSLNISRSVLHVKCKNLLNTSVIDYIRELRMKHARDLLIKGRNISETAYAVGFSDPGYFTKVFKKQFNITPSEFVKNI